jgi:hypothetical protein
MQGAGMATKQLGPFLLWRGIDHNPRPWPRLLHVQVVGWVLLIDGIACGIQFRPSAAK